MRSCHGVLVTSTTSRLDRGTRRVEAVVGVMGLNSQPQVRSWVSTATGPAGRAPVRSSTRSRTALSRGDRRVAQVVGPAEAHGVAPRRRSTAGGGRRRRRPRPGRGSDQGDPVGEAVVDRGAPVVDDPCPRRRRCAAGVDAAVGRPVAAPRRCGRASQVLAGQPPAHHPGALRRRPRGSRSPSRRRRTRCAVTPLSSSWRAGRRWRPASKTGWA